MAHLVASTKKPPFSGRLIVAGTSAKDLLQGQLTCDLNILPSGEMCFGAHCNRQGKIISFFQIQLSEGQYQLNMPVALVPIAMVALQKYAALYRNVTLTNDSEGICSYTSSLENIRLGIPALYPETSEKFFTHELNLQQMGAVSLEKGCYTGQEIIARMYYRGKPKSGLLHVTAASTQPPVRGNDIFTKSGACGCIVDFAKSDNGQFELLITAPFMQADALFMDKALNIALIKV